MIVSPTKQPATLKHLFRFFEEHGWEKMGDQWWNRGAHKTVKVWPNPVKDSWLIATVFDDSYLSDVGDMVVYLAQDKSITYIGTANPM